MDKGWIVAAIVLLVGVASALVLRGCGAVII